MLVGLVNINPRQSFPGTLIVLIVFIVVEIMACGTDGGMAYVGVMKKDLVGFWVDFDLFYVSALLLWFPKTRGILMRK